MFAISAEKIGEVTVILCKGRMIGSDAALRLRDAVTTQTDSKFVLLDLSELVFLGGEALGMLIFLQAWSRNVGIEFKLFDPSPAVWRTLQTLRSTSDMGIASISEVLSTLQWEGPKSLMRPVVQASRLKVA